MAKTLTNEQKLRKENGKLRKFLKDITIFEDALAEYTECANWKNQWWTKPKYRDLYNKDDKCPCIDCTVCIAKQALEKEHKNKN